MNPHTPLSTIPIGKRRRRVLLHVAGALIALLALVPRSLPAHAATTPGPTCFLTLSSSSGSVCPQYPPPDLLLLNQPLYAASPAQAASLRDLETQAIANTIKDHGLAATDGAAVQSWGRTDAEAELFALLVQAINATSRTPDQQNAVDWIAAVEQRHAEMAAQDAGFEYAKWAGLDQGAYQNLLNSNASESDIESFLSTTPEAYNNTIKNSLGGYCNYRSPAPYGSEYTGYNDQICFTPCTSLLGCLPPTPTYDQFTKWGEADADNATLSSFQATLQSGLIAVGLTFGAAAVGAGVTAVTLSTGMAEALVGTALQEAVLPYAGTYPDYELAAEVDEEADLVVDEAAAASEIASSAGAIVGVLIAAITTAVIEGINVTNAAKLPGQLATLIVDARATTTSPASLLSDNDGATTLYSLFVGATLPMPQYPSCDNSSDIPPWDAGMGSAGPGVPGWQAMALCLNAPAIPPASPTNSYFLVTPRGGVTPRSASTITWEDAATQSTTTARLSGDWFIDQVHGSSAAAQALSIAYTDWSGNEQVAWLLGSPAGRYQFVGYNATTGAGQALNPATCLSAGTCWTSSTIDYVGSNGQDDSASVQPYSPPTGSPSYSTPVQGSPVAFNANNYAPGAAQSPIMYAWRFQKAGCGEGFGTGSNSVTVLCPNWPNLAQVGVYPDYTPPLPGSKVTYTFPTTGQYLVQLTATDATGKQAVDTFTVNVGDVPPTLNLSAGCPQCAYWTASLGTSVTIKGAITFAGSGDSELVLVNWGDGSSEDIQSAGPLQLLLSGTNPLTLTPNPRAPAIGLSDTHTYAQAGTYTGTVTVIDQGGGTTSQTFTEAILPAGAPVLVRYYAPGVSHWVTTGPVSAGYQREQSLGYVYAQPAGAFTTALYGCLHGSADYFLSHDPACEGWTVLRTEGYVSSTAMPGGVAIYRCRTNSDHFASTDPKCEGQTTEGLLGYVVAISQAQGAGIAPSKAARMA